MLQSRDIKPMDMILLIQRLTSGASAIICEILPEKPDKNICWIKTADSAKALGLAASNFFGNPSSPLSL